MILSVGDVNSRVKYLINGDTLLTSLYVRGEISNFKLHSSGHMYLTLKDEEGVLRSVMFRGNATKLKFRPENGMKIITHGRIDVFARDGQYQLYIDEMIPDGIGALYLAYEQLKNKLAAEGLFDTAHKKPIPRCPQRIALVTSPTGAAIRDMLRILRARWPIARIRIYPVRVQGIEAPPEICEGIEFINRYNLADLIITGRGGGSIEDLWAFNDENVARAIYDSEIPIISAVGHEPDFTIADFVADLRAATPSNGAELAVPDRMELKESLRHLGARLYQLEKNRIELGKKRVEALAGRRVLTSPMGYIEDRSIYFDNLTTRFINTAERQMEARRLRFAKTAGLIEALSPVKVLARGYAITADESGSIIKSADSLKIGQNIRINFTDGRADCRVEEIRGGKDERR